MYDLLETSIDESKLDEDEKEIWGSVRSNAAIQMTVDNTALLEAIDGRFSPSRRSTRRETGRGVMQRWEVDEWDGIQKMMEGTAYEGVFDSGEAYLSFINQLHDPSKPAGSPAEERFNALGREALSQLLGANAEYGEVPLETVAAEYVNKGLQFFGIQPADVKEESTWIDNNGNPQTQMLYSTQKMISALQEVGLQPSSNPAPQTSEEEEVDGA